MISLLVVQNQFSSTCAMVSLLMLEYFSKGAFHLVTSVELQKIYSEAALMMHLFCLQVLHYDLSTGENELGLTQLHCRPDDVFGYPSLSSFIGISDIGGIRKSACGVGDKMGQGLEGKVEQQKSAAA